MYDNRDLTIELFCHFRRTANVKKSCTQGFAVRFAVWGSRLHGKTTLQRQVILPQGFLHPKRSLSHVWEEIRRVKTLLLIDYQILFQKNVILKTISQLKYNWVTPEWMNENKHPVESYHPRIGSPKYGQTGNVKPSNQGQNWTSTALS